MQPRIKIILEEANQCLKSGDFQNAITKYNKVIAGSNCHEAFAGRAEAHLSTWKFKAFLTDLSTAIQLDPTNCDYLFKRADYQTSIGQYPEAITDYKIILQISPNNTDAIKRCSNVYIKYAEKSGNSAISISAFLEAFKLKSEYVQTHANTFQSKFYRLLVDQVMNWTVQETIQHSTATIGFFSSYYGAYLIRAEAYVKVKMFRSAIEDSAKAIQCNSNFELILRAYCCIIESFVSMEEYRYALHNIEQIVNIISLQIENHYSNYSYSDIPYTLKISSCINHLSQAVPTEIDLIKKIKSSIVNVINYRASSLSLGQYTEWWRSQKTTLCTEMITSCPEAEEPYVKRAAHYIYQERYDEAMADLKQVETLNPNRANKDIVVMRAKIYFHKKQFNHAVDNIEIALWFLISDYRVNKTLYLFENAFDLLDIYKKILFFCTELQRKSIDEKRDIIRDEYVNLLTDCIYNYVEFYKKIPNLTWHQLLGNLKSQFQTIINIYPDFSKIYLLRASLEIMEGHDSQRLIYVQEAWKIGNISINEINQHFELQKKQLTLMRDNAVWDAVQIDSHIKTIGMIIKALPQLVILSIPLSALSTVLTQLTLPSISVPITQSVTNLQSVSNVEAALNTDEPVEPPTTTTTTTTTTLTLANIESSQPDNSTKPGKKTLKRKRKLDETNQVKRPKITPDQLQSNATASATLFSAKLNQDKLKYAKMIRILRANPMTGNTFDITTNCYPLGVDFIRCASRDQMPTGPSDTTKKTKKRYKSHNVASIIKKENHNYIVSTYSVLTRVGQTFPVMNPVVPEIPHQYHIYLISVESRNYINEMLYVQAINNKMPIVIREKTALGDQFFIFGDENQNGDWKELELYDLTDIEKQTLDGLPYEKEILKYTDELFTPDLLNLLKLAHTPSNTIDLDAPITSYTEDNIKLKSCDFETLGDTLKKLASEFPQKKSFGFLEIKRVVEIRYVLVPISNERPQPNHIQVDCQGDEFTFRLIDTKGNIKEQSILIMALSFPAELSTHISHILNEQMNYLPHILKLTTQLGYTKNYIFPKELPNHLLCYIATPHAVLIADGHGYQKWGSSRQQLETPVNKYLFDIADLPKNFTFLKYATRSQSKENIYWNEVSYLHAATYNPKLEFAHIKPEPSTTTITSGMSPTF